MPARAPSLSVSATPQSRFLPSAREMAAYDAAAIAGGTSAAALMERAGAAVVRALLRHPRCPQRPRMLVLCGPGNNGGDGLVIARLLRRQKYQVRLVLCAHRRYSEEHLAQLAIFCEEGGAVELWGADPAPELSRFSTRSIDEPELKAAIERSQVIVDALLGTGQSGAPRGMIRDLLHVLSEATHDPFVVSVDVPTGINSDNGEVYEGALRADLTVTIEMPKRGLVQFPAREYCGELVTEAIGIGAAGAPEFAISTGLSLPHRPRRHPNAHKGSAGRIVVVGGCRAMPGASALSARAALRCGSGLVTRTAFHGALPDWAEVLLLPLDSDHLLSDQLSSIQALLSSADAAVIGPGLGAAEATRESVHALVRWCSEKKIPTVLDADGLNAFSGKAFSGLDLSSTVLTPHPAEMGRMLGISTEEVQRDRYGAARALGKETRAVVILKGAATIVYWNNSGVVNSTGNGYMATAGTGDVLSGCIASLCGQGMGVRDAAVLGVYVHAAAGDLASIERKGPIIASDLIEKLGDAFALREDVETSNDDHRV